MKLHHDFTGLRHWPSAVALAGTPTTAPPPPGTTCSRSAATTATARDVPTRPPCPQPVPAAVPAAGGADQLRAAVLLPAVTEYVRKSYYEPVTKKVTSYYYEPVTEYKYTTYYDPAPAARRRSAPPARRTGCAASATR